MACPKSLTYKQCQSAIFYPHIKWKRLCTITFRGRPSTLFCRKCSGRIKATHKNTPGFKSKGVECARPECLKLFVRIKNRRTKYCEECKGIVHLEQMRDYQAAIRAENVRRAAINARKPAYTSGYLQRLQGDRLTQAINSILRGESIIT